MRYRTLYELMDLYEDDEVGLKLNSPVDAGRVLEMTMARLGPRTAGRQGGKRPARRWTVRLAIAAALALGLSVTAWAVYQAMMEDYLVQTPTQLDAIIEDLGGETGPGATLSLVGYQGTPEYEAYTEWEAWQAEHYGEHPMDNSNWHETPDNYYELYGAAWQDQADALDRISAKYGVRLHENMAFADAEQIYELLGSKPFLLNEYDWASGYIYNDGTFNLDFGSDHNGVSDGGGIFVSVKGTITDISGYMGPGEYEEWSYQTASGPTVDLVLRSGGTILCETESAYIRVSVHTQENMSPDTLVPYTREDLQGLADSIDFGELARLFGPGASFDLADAMEELDAAYWREMQENAEQAQEQEEKADAQERVIAQQVIGELGVYGPDPIPEGYQLKPMMAFFDGEPRELFTQRRDDAWVYWDEEVCRDEIEIFYSHGTGDDPAGFWLRYMRCFADSSRAVSVTAEKFRELKAYFSAYEGFTECQVNGCPGFYFPTVKSDNGLLWNSGVIWLDEANELLFDIGRDGGVSEDGYTPEPFTKEELIALAATVTAE